MNIPPTDEMIRPKMYIGLQVGCIKLLTDRRTYKVRRQYS